MLKKQGRRRESRSDSTWKKAIGSGQTMEWNYKHKRFNRFRRRSNMAPVRKPVSNHYDAVWNPLWESQNNDKLR